MFAAPISFEFLEVIFFQRIRALLIYTTYFLREGLLQGKALLNFMEKYSGRK